MGTPQAVAGKKTSLTPKAILHQKFGAKACYTIEEVREPTQNGCPGLAIVQKGPCLYRCHLELPEFSVVSETFKKKKDAEQSASEIALGKMGINPRTYDPMVQDPWDEMTSRLSYVFSYEFLSSLHPLSNHLKAILRRQGELKRSVPISVLAAYDPKVNSLCRTINPKIESDPLLATTIIMKAASRLSELIATSKDQLSLIRENLYSPEIIESAVNLEPGLPESLRIKVIRVPSLAEKTVEILTLEVNSNCYYLDVIAQELELKDASAVLVSRTIGKASSELRLYFSALSSCLDDSSAGTLSSLEDHHFERSLNLRASYLAGNPIYGDAILASIGYTWKSADLFCEDVSFTTYYRMLLNKIPSGIYKLSRDAILVAELPEAFTTKNNWRGSYPRELLSMFCRQHHLSEPVFPTVGNNLESFPESNYKKVCGSSDAVTGSKPVTAEESFRCHIIILSKCQDVLIECYPKESFKKQNDAIQSAALKVMLWLNMYFKKIGNPLEEFTSSADAFDILFHPKAFAKAFSPCVSVLTLKQSLEDDQEGKPVKSSMVEDFHIDGQGSGASPSNGYLVCIAYSVSLVKEREAKKELIESSEEFEFEVGTSAVISSIEAVVSQMCVGQSARFYVELPPDELFLASARDYSRILPFLSSGGCSLEYSITMWRMTEPMEDRMEQALFSPPLSKQRVEYAVHHIRDSCATSLVDFGCGSGSLLESLLDYSTSLHTIVGVDLSKKGLTRAAKTLHSKLSGNSDVTTRMGVKSVLLYEGSILEYDSRLFGFDIGTCLEVIEHMEEHEANLFGDIVLSYFCPKILIVSTPNYEYNVIIQRSSFQTQSDEAAQPCKFRNLDHKFEWTRQQFSVWASDLAMRHGYEVEFSGVGRTPNDDVAELGYASQIAVFKRGDGEYSMNEDSTHRYGTLWEWISDQKM